jgi:aspartate aminotransferase
VLAENASNQKFGFASCPNTTTIELPATFNRLAWSNLAAQSAEQIALAAAPIITVRLLGVGEGQTGALQTALTLPFVLVAIPAGLLADRMSRRLLMAGSEALRAAITPKTKAVLLNSPNNPTGVVYPAGVIKSLAAVLEEKEREYGSPIYLVSDEPYRELAYDGVEVPYLTRFYKNTIVCYSWSKSLSLPGERIGYIAIPSELDDYQLIFDAAGIATRVLGFVNAPSLIQKVVAKCLEETTDLSAYDTNRKQLYNGLVDCGFEPVFPQGAFYMWVKTPGDDKEFAEAAKKHNILLVPGASFGCPGYARIAYCVAKKTIEDSLPGFKKLAAGYGLHPR